MFSYVARITTLSAFVGMLLPFILIAAAVTHVGTLTFTAAGREQASRKREPWAS
jgi:hypothetical protein